jgi:hypothetical protein
LFKTTNLQAQVRDGPHVALVGQQHVAAADQCFRQQMQWIAASKTLHLQIDLRHSPAVGQQPKKRPLHPPTHECMDKPRLSLPLGTCPHSKEVFLLLLLQLFSLFIITVTTTISTLLFAVLNTHIQHTCSTSLGEIASHPPHLIH